MNDRPRCRSEFSDESLESGPEGGAAQIRRAVLAEVCMGAVPLVIEALRRMVWSSSRRGLWEGSGGADAVEWVCQGAWCGSGADNFVALLF